MSQEISNKDWSGYAGQILEVDLSSQTCRVDPLDPVWAEAYMGGKGLGAKILYDRLKPGCDPLEPDNILVFATGPLTGTLSPSSGRFEACAKSPQTGLWLDCNCGGSFGPELKYCGYDAVIITGRADSPVILHLEDGKAQLRPAGELWGMDTLSTHKQIKDKEGEDCRVACIGPAGEQGVLFASIISEYRALGRGGIGSVMGSKNLKAVSAKGNKSLRLHDADLFMRTRNEAMNELSIHPDTGGGRPKYGTNVILSLMDETGIHPVRNFQKGELPPEQRISEEDVARYYVRNRACAGCPIHCSKIARVSDGKYKNSFTEGPEYENTWAFGANCENSDLGAVIEAEYLCDYYGMDGISTGSVISFLMECREKGVLDEKELGVDLAFGNHEAMIQAVHLIGKSKGPGKLWGQGVRRLAAEYAGAENFAMHVKGMELPAYDPRLSTGMSLAYATSDRGGCHLRSWPIGEELLASEGRMDQFSTEFKAELVKTQQDLFGMVNCSGICLFATFALSLQQIVPFLYSATGIESFSTAEGVMEIGERVNNLVRLINLREGLTKDDDTLPKRLLQEALKEGPGKGYRVSELDSLKDDYYFVRGWDKNGTPLKNKLYELGLKGE
ncbi:MAG: aldehyde ferredoxin oxidoreductase family protein [Desulfobacterales bacterium]|nr:aldehyde ferredoxin oxidoreductase family protein [Desulfobacterales bacterium]